MVKPVDAVCALALTLIFSVKMKNKIIRKFMIIYLIA
jgi:hypothetical protein